ncbi:MAG: TRAP transporter small permease subunit [Pseudomonadota bacterium]
MIDAILLLLTELFNGFVNIFIALSQPLSWLDWSDPQALIRFIYYGGSHQFLFSLIVILLFILVIGLIRRPFLWGVTTGLEFFGNWMGRIFAWVGLMMVLQQIMIVFLQRIFRVSEISLAPGGAAFTRDLSWWSEELKLYNAIVVCLCCAYTFIQGGHVRVDLFYAGVRYRTKRIIDMAGSLIFILPSMSLIWLYAWYFMWRHLVTPKVSASDQLELMERRAQLLRWDRETIGFSPNGFDEYWLFKLLIVLFAGTMFLQGVATFFRALLEYIEGPEAEGKHLDKDRLDDEVAEAAATAH